MKDNEKKGKRGRGRPAKHTCEEKEPVGETGAEAVATTAISIADEETNWTIQLCPYFKQDRGRGHICCEGATFKFPDKLARREYVYRFCAHPEGYKQCQLKLTMDHFYERKYAYHE